MTAERGRKRGETLVHINFSNLLERRQGKEEPPQNPSSKQNKKTKNAPHSHKKKREEREQKQPTKKNKKNKKNKKKQKKLLDAQKSLFLLLKKFSLSSSYCAALIETNNGPPLLLLRGAKQRGEDDEQQQKQRSDQRTLRITLKPRPETRGREIRVRGFECDEARWENQAPAVYQSWEFRVASSRCKRRPPRGEEIRKERESKRNE
jgi:YesN/AraC family two-component response regulator